MKPVVILIAMLILDTFIVIHGYWIPFGSHDVQEYKKQNQRDVDVGKNGDHGKDKLDGNGKGKHDGDDHGNDGSKTNKGNHDQHDDRGEHGQDDYHNSGWHNGGRSGGHSRNHSNR